MRLRLKLHQLGGLSAIVCADLLAMLFVGHLATNRADTIADMKSAEDAESMDTTAMTITRPEY